MELRSPLLRFLLVSLLIASLILVIAACGGDEDDGAGPGAAPELQDGVLSVGSDIAYPPMEFFITGTEDPDGFDIDLAKALAAELGVEAEFINTGFDGIILALQTEEFDIIMSAMTITEEREEQIGFIPYLNVGTGIVVPAGNPDNIQDLEDLCGLTVTVQIGTIQEQMANEIECAEDSVNVVTFDTNPPAVEDVRTGGADANLSDFPVALFDAQESGGALEVVEAQLAPEPYGIGVRKESEALRQALEGALQTLRDNGTYDELLEKWGLTSARLD
jgi:polar amino acid transport system substrate-binding protein